jgi:hypothetical protein
MSDVDQGALFMTAFAELKARAQDDPDRLMATWESDERMQQLCDVLHDCARTFEIAEDWSAFAFTPHVIPASAQARRDYEERWSRRVAYVSNRWLQSILDGLVGDAKPAFDRRPDELSIEIGNWRCEAEDERKLLDQAFDHLESIQEFDHDGNLDWVTYSVRAWTRLRKVCGLDVEGALWRRRALPHMLVPVHVANHYGQNRASLYRRLHQAGRAFIFGAPLAALALQRAALEELLQEHWGAEKGHVRSAKLPELSWDSRADRLKRLANEALHNDPEKLSADQLDRAIIENFLLLRLLIEHAPADPGEHQRQA